MGLSYQIGRYIAVTWSEHIPRKHLLTGMMEEPVAARRLLLAVARSRLYMVRLAFLCSDVGDRSSRKGCLVGGQLGRKCVMHR